MNNPLGMAKDLFQLQREAKEMEKRMKEQRFHGKSKKDLITVTIDGTQNIIDMKVDDLLMSPDMKESLVNNMKEAFADAQKNAQKAMASSMDLDKIKSMLGGLK
jgi:DNA-binding protein YbaB